ncbi:MAG: hypothetical protein VYE64_00840 [Planctomycetota bacterium]|nr:hypothetical protein [Planctomycetota bacterium]
MKRLFLLIAWTITVALPGVTHSCYASIEAAVDSREMVEQISSGSESEDPRLPRKSRFEQQHKPASTLPTSLSPNALSSHATGLNATLLKTAWQIQLSPQHKVYLQTALQWPILPPWEILKVPIAVVPSHLLF